MAAWQDYTADDGVRIRRGEVIASYGFLATRWGVSKDTAFNWIKHWIAERQVERRTERCTERSAERFFVLNYAKYQDSAERESERVSERTGERSAEQIKVKVESKREKVNDVCPTTNSLITYIDELCQQYGIENGVNARSLDVHVLTYENKIHLRTEVRKCVGWLIDKHLKKITAPRLANWFATAQKISKREELRSLEWKQAQKDPYLAASLKQTKVPRLTGIAQSVEHFSDSQLES